MPRGGTGLAPAKRQGVLVVFIMGIGLAVAVVLGLGVDRQQIQEARIEYLTTQVNKQKALAAVAHYKDIHNQWYLKFDEHPSVESLNAYRCEGFRVIDSGEIRESNEGVIYYNTQTGSLTVWVGEWTQTIKGLPNCPQGPPI